MKKLNLFLVKAPVSPRKRWVVKVNPVEEACIPREGRREDPVALYPTWCIEKM